MTSCARCGTSLGPDDEFCTQCGASGGTAPPRVRRGLPLPAVVVVVVALLAAGGTAAWYAVGEPIAASSSTSEEGSAAPSGDVPALPPASRGSSVPADPAAALAAQVEADRPRAEESVGYWVPQISSKAVGMEVNGVAYDAARILDEFRDANRAYDAFLVRSDDYSTFKRPGFVVTLVPQRFSDPREANSWCVTNGFRPVDCFAKRLSHTDGPDGNTLQWGG